MNGRLKYGPLLAMALAVCVASAGCRTETTTSVTPASDGSPGISTTVTTTTPVAPARPSGPTSSTTTTTVPAPDKATTGQPALSLSPLAGRWAGKSDMKDKGIDTFINSVKGGPLTGPSYLTLNADGTGYMQVGDKRDRPITWKPDEKNIIIKRSANDSGGTDSGLGDGPWVGTISDDAKTMHVDMAKVRLTLYKK